MSPATPTATLMSPSRHGRPNVSAMMMPSSWPVSCRSRSRIAARRAVGVLRQEARGIGVDIGLVDARVGADPAVVRLHDEHALVASHHPPALAQDHLRELRVAPELEGERLRAGRRRDLGEADEAPLGLGDDLLAHHEDVAGLERCLLPARRLVNEAGEVVASPDLGQSLDADHLVSLHLACPWLGFRCGRCQDETRAALRVCAPRARSRSRSSGVSMSRPSPGSSRMTGVRPRWRAASR